MHFAANTLTYLLLLVINILGLQLTVIFISDQSADYFLDSIYRLVQKMSITIAHADSLLEVSKLFVLANQLSKTHRGDPNKQ